MPYSQTITLSDKLLKYFLKKKQNKTKKSVCCIVVVGYTSSLGKLLS